MITWEPQKHIGHEENVWTGWGYDKEGNEYEALLTYDYGYLGRVEEKVIVIKAGRYDELKIQEIA